MLMVRAHVENVKSLCITIAMCYYAHTMYAPQY